MINSIENRSPFLDYRLFKYIFMNENYKIKNGFNKYILRDCVPSNVPDSIKWRRQKFGMTNVFSNDNFFTKESCEMIMDSNFINSFIEDKDLLMKEFSLKSNIILQLLSLAVLDDHYGLYLN
jgi:asparagine synthase (glutamine-hydrolysing)